MNIFIIYKHRKLSIKVIIMFEIHPKYVKLLDLH